MERRNMNKNYKVVFSKARGALMVVNELTSSVQAKGTKTVIAGAVASLVAGGAMAAEPSLNGGVFNWDGAESRRECQDFCVWGGYSRGSPTRLPFVFCDAVCQT